MVAVQTARFTGFSICFIALKYKTVQEGFGSVQVGAGNVKQGENFMVGLNLTGQQMKGLITRQLCLLNEVKFNRIKRKPTNRTGKL